MWRCPAGCGRELDVSSAMPACVECGKRHCLACVKWWPADDDNDDVALCKRHWRIRQVMASQAGEGDGVDKK